MSYVALYRKARPTVFDALYGQDHVVIPLRNQVINDRTQHAYLFCGTRGTGKTSAAKILARAVNCENPVNGNPCNECPTCRAILAGSSMNVIEIDAASNNGVDNIRDIIEEVRYRPTSGRFKVYIIDEVHMLSGGAFNALLKTLEEPPSYVIFILATTDPGKIPLTILSRCQRYDFRRIGVPVIMDRMRQLLDEEQVEYEEKALHFIGRAADGSMRDALSLLDRCIAFYYGQPLTYERALAAIGAVETDVLADILKAVLKGDAGSAVRLFEEMMEGGREVGQFVTDLIWYLRNLLLVRAAGSEAADLVDVSEEQMASLMDMGREVEPETLMRYIRVLSGLQNDLRNASNRRILTEVALINLARPQMEIKTDAVLDRLRQVEGRLLDIESGALAISAAPPAVKAVLEVPERADRPPAPNAAPEDLRRIAGEWDRIRQMIPPGFLRTALKNSECNYDAVGQDNKLYVRLLDGAMAGFFSDKHSEERKNWQDAVAQTVEDVCGVRAEVVFVGAADGNRGLYRIDPLEKAREDFSFDVDQVPDDEFDVGDFDF